MQRRDFLRAALAAPLVACQSAAQTPGPAPAAAASSAGPPVASAAPPIASAAPPIASAAPPMRRLIVVDMHNHVYPPGTNPHPPKPEDPKAWGGTPPPPPMERLFQKAYFEMSGFTTVCASFVLDFTRLTKAGDARANLFAWLDAIDAALKTTGIRRALKWSDVEADYDRKQPTIVQSVEGAQFIEGDVKRVEEVYARGLRHLQLLHDKDDLVAPLANAGGLTPVGVEVVKECARLGIVVDLAHANAATIAAAAKTTKHPLIVSHTNLDTWTGRDAKLAKTMKPRLISRDTAKLVADTGGVVGVWTKLTEFPSDWAASVKAMVDAIGIDHVGLGTDTDMLSDEWGQSTDRPWRRGDIGLGKGVFAALAEEMRKQGLRDDDIAKIAGGNYGRVFAKVAG